jgi:hypothetical protein
LATLASRRFGSVSTRFLLIQIGRVSTLSSGGVADFGEVPNMKNLLGKINSSANKILAALALAFVSIQTSFAQTGLVIPAGTDTTLISYINDAFGVIIGVVVVVIAAGLIIKMLRKAGG